MTPELSVSKEHKPATRNRNNFNVLRFVAASLVVVSHGFELPSGVTQHDWAFSLTGRALSWYAVNMFFVISGYLIFVSWQRNPSAIAFFWNRFLRILPGLFIMLILTTLILGAGFSTIGLWQFLRSQETLAYFAGCLSIVFVKYKLPGVFSGNPLDAVNGSLWTLRYEIFCYFCVGILGFIGLLKHRAVRRVILFGALVSAMAVLVVFDARGVGQSDGKLGMAYELARLGMCFLLGGLYSEVETILPLKFWFALTLSVVMIFVAHTSMFVPIAVIATAYGAIWCAFVPKGKWVVWTRGAPDYSYGIYIYAFPIQQALISLVPGIAPWQAIIVGFAVTLAFAAFSWHLVESPALTLKGFASDARRSMARLKPTIS